MPKLMREFSREHAPEERRQVADAIKAKRVEAAASRRESAERQKILEESATEQERALAETLSDIENLSAQIEKISSTMMGKVLNVMKIRKIRADILTGQKTYDELKKIRDENLAEMISLQEVGSQKESAHQEETAALLDTFYKDLTERWESSGYGKEDLKQYFSEEYLASLSVKDYGILLKRFPSEMVTHVTRQGVRDHIGMQDHTHGMGKYTPAFMQMAADGRLRSALGIALIERTKEEAVAHMLKLENCEDREQALLRLDYTTKVLQSEPRSYADRTAIHMATEAVADKYYGAERGNEIFIAYPAAHIASQYLFTGPLNHGDVNPQNDQWIWANEERGMDLNAGLVFIPAEARVDPSTGSRFELNDERDPIPHTENFSSFQRVVLSPDFAAFARKAIDVLKVVPPRYLWDDPQLTRGDENPWRDFVSIKRQLEEDFRISDKRLRFAILDQESLCQLLKDSGDEKAINSDINKALDRENIRFHEATTTTTSREFWEDYFSKHPEQKPSKIVYYQGTDPTKALLKWREDMGLNKKAADATLGFPENRILKSSPEATPEINRFHSIAEKIIAERWPRYGTVYVQGKDVEIVSDREYYGEASPDLG